MRKQISRKRKRKLFRIWKRRVFPSLFDENGNFRKGASIDQMSHAWFSKTYQSYRPDHIVCYRSVLTGKSIVVSSVENGSGLNPYLQHKDRQYLGLVKGLVSINGIKQI